LKTHTARSAVEDRGIGLSLWTDMSRCFVSTREKDVAAWTT